jgi:hypothetical protein
MKKLALSNNHWLTQLVVFCMTTYVINIQYWCIDGKYRIYVARLRNGRKTNFNKSFHPFRVEPHKFYIYRQYTNIVFILQ